MCKQESSSDNSRKIYTRKDLVMTEKTISGFRTSFYIPAIKKLVFNLPHEAYLVQITVVQCDTQPSNDMNNVKMFYVVVIMMKG